MFRIGLTGGIGSGKSAASDAFEKLGIKVVDADVVAREVVEPGSPALDAISEHFGNQVITSDHALNRSALREIVFADSQEKQWLEALLHPLIRKEIYRQLNDSASPYTILVSPLLFETDQHLMVDRTLLIDVSEDLQIERASSRDGVTGDQIRQIIDQQMPRQKKLEMADDIISNEASITDLQHQVTQHHQTYLKLAKDHYQV